MTIKKHLFFLKTAILIILLIFTFNCNQPGSSGGSGGGSGGSDSDSDSNVERQFILRNFNFTLPLFAVSSAWNETVTGKNVLTNSDNQILTTYRVLRGDTTGLTNPPGMNYPFMYLNYEDYTVAICQAGTKKRDVTLYDYESGEGWATEPKITINQSGNDYIAKNIVMPLNLAQPSGPTGIDSDGHLVIYQINTKTSWDFWQASTQLVNNNPKQSRGGGLPGADIFAAGHIDYFDVTGTGVNSPGNYSARSSGVPLLAGLIIPEDIELNEIKHALAFAIPCPKNNTYYSPASIDEPDYYNTNTHAMAHGQRIRLKSVLYDENGNIINESNLAPITTLLLKALRQYGAYLVDNAGGFIFYAEDIYTANLELTDAKINELIGMPQNSALSSNKTKWQIVMDKLLEEMETIPIAYGPWTDGQNPSQALVTYTNFEVIENFIP
jgi:hypothetical protein